MINDSSLKNDRNGELSPLDIFKNETNNLGGSILHHLENVLDHLAGCFQYKSAGIFNLEDRLKLIAHRGEQINNHLLELFSAPGFDLALKNHLTFISEPNQHSQLLSQPLVQYLNPGITIKNEFSWDLPTTWICIPIQLKERLFGFIFLDKKQDRKFLYKEFKQVRIISELVAILMEKECQIVEARQSTSEVKAIISVQQALTSRLDLEPVLQLIADEARRLTNTRSSYLLLKHGDLLRTEALSGTYSPDVHIGYEIPINKSFTGSSVLSGKPVWVVDALDNPNVYKGKQLQVRSYISVPLISESKTIGAIVVADKVSGKFEKNDEQITSMLADSAVIAVENARLYQKAQERRLEAENRRRVAEGLRELLTVLNSHQSPKEVLKRITQQACRLLGSDASAISLLQGDGKTHIIEASFGFSDELQFMKQYEINKLGVEITYRKGIPIVFSEINNTKKNDYENKNIFSTRFGVDFLISEYQTAIAVPLRADETAYGELLLFYRENRYFQDEEIELAVQVGDHAALAIKNSHLHEQVDELARLQERQRIAQSLHDSVAQMLFSLGLEVEETININQRGESMEKPLETIRRLASRSSHELRNAIFTLREVKHTEHKTGIIALIDELIMEFKVHTGVAITFITPATVPTIKTSVIDVIYRIVREALSNITKHSYASAVIVNLTYDDQIIQILIQDDGIGLQQDFSNQENDNYLHFGVAMMRQLTNQVHGEFFIKNGDEQGVLIKASFPINGDVI